MRNSDMPYPVETLLNRIMKNYWKQADDLEISRHLCIPWHPAAQQIPIELNELRDTLVLLIHSQKMKLKVRETKISEQDVTGSGPHTLTTTS